MNYTLVFANEVYDDLQQSIDWYNEAKAGLGSRFYFEVKNQIKTINKTPFIFAIRYDDVRCAKIEKFPYLIHFKIFSKEKIIKVIAIFSTNRDPIIWEERNI
jgi:hypothetical protein